jgi:carbamoyl-phosphate synthase large subunit
LAQGFARLGFTIHATRGTAEFLASEGIPTTRVGKISEGSPNIIDLITSGKVDLLINTMSKDHKPGREGIRIRRATVEHSIPCLTSLDTAQALLTALSSRQEGEQYSYKTIDEYLHTGGDAARPEPVA